MPLNLIVRPWFQISGFHPATNRQIACRRQAYAVRHASVRCAAHATANAPPPACSRHRQRVAHVAGGRSNLAPAIHATAHCGGSFGGRHLVHVHSRLHGLTNHSSRRRIFASLRLASRRRGLIQVLAAHAPDQSDGEIQDGCDNDNLSASTGFPCGVSSRPAPLLWGVG